MKRTSLIDVDDAAPRQEDNDSGGSRNAHGSAKLARAGEIARKTEEELATLCQGLNDRIEDLGLTVRRANEYRGMEKLLHVAGAMGIGWAQRSAAVRRRERLRTLRTDEAVAEIGQIVLATIGELGDAENEYERDQQEYEAKLTEVLAKQEEATPLYTDALELRQQLETEIAALEQVLAKADLKERPAQERKFEAKKRDLDAAKLDEATYLAVVKNAHEAIPELQKNRDAATNAIQSLHGMRQSMLEKFADFRVVLERATTAMRARASIELFQDADPAFNAALGSITANNVATAGAALEVWTDRIQQAAIDPAKSQELLLELLQHITDAAAKLAVTEKTVAGDPRELVPITLPTMEEEKVPAVPVRRAALDLYAHRPVPKG